MSPRSGLQQSHESEEFVLGFLYLTLYIYSGGWAETGGRCRDALGWRIVRGKYAAGVNAAACDNCEAGKYSVAVGATAVNTCSDCDAAQSCV